MNYQAVEQAQGQNVTMMGVITEFKGEGVNANSGKPWKKVVIQDANGQKHNVTLRGTLPGPQLVNQQAEFSLGTYQGTYQNAPYTGYSGFWNSNVNVQQPAQGQQAPPQGTQQQQPPQQAPPQNTYHKPAQVSPRDYDKENRGKCRCNFYQGCLQAGMLPSNLAYNDQELKAIEVLVKNSMDGLGQPTFTQDGQAHDNRTQFQKDYNLPADDDNVPFE